MRSVSCHSPLNTNIRCGFLPCKIIIPGRSREHLSKYRISFCLSLEWQLLKITASRWEKQSKMQVQAMSHEFNALYSRSPLLTAGDSNCAASKCVLTHAQAGWPLLSLSELLLVESSPILPCMHYLVFFFEL